ncbi:MAG: hypothetical protein IRY99_13875 [Isosphaeraceae bacterium]|nr:hypothetical protein [Isosphaeraceae bacterium]
MVFEVLLLAALVVASDDTLAAMRPDELPRGDEVKVDTERGEVRFAAKVQHPRGKPCIDTFGQRIQAFVGCAKAGGRRTEFADHFVFLAPADTEAVYRGLTALGLNTKVHYSRAEGRQRAGKDFLQGDPVALFIAWQEGGRWVERRYEDLVQEKIRVGDQEIVRPWRPHFVFHGSGVIHQEGTGCIACPCDCPGGIIADNRLPIYEPKPTVKFDWTKAPPEGTTVIVRIRPAGDTPR